MRPGDAVVTAMSRKVRAALAVALCAAACLALCAGCATSDAESDLPWNMSQPWESSPGVPGLNNGY